MVAPNFQSARVGSGGISFAMTADKSQLRATLDEATADIKRWKADIKERAKLKVDIDYEETQAVRGFEAFIRKIKRENAKIRIGVELDKVGLGDLYREVNGLKKKAVRIEDWRPEMTPEMQSRESIRVARAEYQERLDLERKFEAQLENESRTKGGAGGGGGIGLRSLLRGGVYGYALNQLSRMMSASTGINEGLALANSSDPMLRDRGNAAAMSSAQSIPVVGSLIRAFDEMNNITGRLNASMRVREQMEGIAARRAEIGGNAFSIATEQAVASRRDLRRQREEMNAKFEGSQAGFIDSLIGHRFSKADRRNQWDLHKIDLLILEEAKLEKQQRDQALFDSDTAVGTASMRAQNFGLRLADEDALNGIREIKSNIMRAKDPLGRQRASLEGMAQLRAMRAGLLPRGGGFGASGVNLATDMIGDPFNLDPTLNARARALGMTDQAISQLSQATAPQINLGGIGAFMPGVMRSAINNANFAMQSISFSRAQNNQLQLGEGGVTEKSLDYASQTVRILGQIKELLGRDTFLK